MPGAAADASNPPPHPLALSRRQGIHNGYLLAAGLVLTSLTAVIAVNHTFYHQTRYGAYAYLSYTHTRRPRSSFL